MPGDRAERHLDAVRRHLRDLVSDAGLSLAEIDRRLGRREGHLSQVLRGEIDLRYEHLLRVLDALDYDPATFFAGVFPRRRKRPADAADPPRQSREVVQIYGLGLEEVRRLHRRLERCEAVLERVAAETTGSAQAGPENSPKQ